MIEGKLHFKLCKTPNLWHLTWDVAYMCFMVKEVDIFGHYYPKENEYGVGYTMKQAYQDWEKINERNTRSF